MVCALPFSAVRAAAPHVVATPCGTLVHGGAVHPAPRFAPRLPLQLVCHGLCAPDVEPDPHQSGAALQAALAVPSQLILAVLYRKMTHLQPAPHFADPTQPEIEDSV
jgi:hypothetical protein